MIHRSTGWYKVCNLLERVRFHIDLHLESVPTFLFFAEFDICTEVIRVSVTLKNTSLTFGNIIK